MGGLSPKRWSTSVIESQIPACQRLYGETWKEFIIVSNISCALQDNFETTNTLHTLKNAHRNVRLPMKNEEISSRTNDDAPEDVIYYRLSGTVNKTFHAPKLQILFTSNTLVQPRLRDSELGTMVSFCVHPFTCPRGSACIAHTSRQLNEWVRKHHLG